jgi:anaerobic carbon-monoxide dehydrogenase iron sulfur subunit
MAEKAKKTTKKHRKIKANEKVCIGCKLCEVYCIVEHSKSKNIIRAFNEETPRALSRVLVEESRPITFALQCRHCDEPACTVACMTGALHKDPETGAVLHDREKCVGCWMCVMVCPYGGIQRDLREGKAASKCDLCLELDEPACVAACPNEALFVVEEED